MIRGVIFDYGGTLIRFDGDLAEVRSRAHRALVEGLRREGLSPGEPAFVRRFAARFEAYDRRRAADNVETTAMAVLVATIREEGLPPQPIDRLRRALRAMYAVYESHWKLFPDALESLERIRAASLRMALLSNASDEDNVRCMLAGHRLESFFDPLVISAANGIRKPDPRAFRKVLEAWDLPAGEIVMVGDQWKADILGARGVGLRTVWISAEGQSPPRRLFGPRFSADAQVRTIGEAAAIILHWRELDVL